jgi:flagellar hook-associated protein 1 FlgK
LASLFDIGKSAVQAQRQALNVTGQNIANVNTEGYRKRSADLIEVSGSQSELTSSKAMAWPTPLT